MTATLYDKNGIPIEDGDILKVYHFTDRRRKRHYMFKQALGPVTYTRAGVTHYIKISHLNMSDEYYVEEANGRSLHDYEIVQSIKCDHEDRSRLRARQEGGG